MSLLERTLIQPLSCPAERAATAAELRSGPMAFGEVRSLLADGNVSRLLVDPCTTPMEAGESVRTVPAGLDRALVARDRTRVGDGCDVPASRCQVRHLATPSRRRGRLTWPPQRSGAASTPTGSTTVAGP